MALDADTPGSIPITPDSANLDSADSAGHDFGSPVAGSADQAGLKAASPELAKPNRVPAGAYHPAAYDRDSTPSAELMAEMIESDPALVPTSPSRFLVEPSVLDVEEVQALLADLGALLRSTEGSGFPTDLRPESAGSARPGEHAGSGVSHEPNTPSDGRDRRNPKLSPFAWLFPDHAGIGRSTGHQQGHHLRARRRSGKKARPAPRQTQGALFGDHVG